MSTIFAVSSGRPPAAIAVVRVSGPQALAAAEALGDDDAPEHEGQGRGLVPLERFADDEDGEARAEDRHEVNEHPRAVRADQFDAPHERELGDQGRAEGHESDDGPPLRCRPDQGSGSLFEDEGGQGGHEGRQRHRREEGQAGHLGAVGEGDGVAGIEQAGAEHQHVADVEGERRQDVPVAVGRRDARAAKDFGTSDAIRDELAAAGVEVMDGDPLGWDWKLG